jgi:tRNA(fMet)-specific endonuclease VapC
VTPYCFDTDVVNEAIGPDPSLDLIRRLAALPAEEQYTTAITVSELLYGAARKSNRELARRIREFIPMLARVLPFDLDAAEQYGVLRASLEQAGKRLAEPDLRIASIALARDLTLVTGNTRHFARVPGLRVEDWLRH